MLPDAEEALGTQGDEREENGALNAELGLDPVLGANS